MRLIRNSQDDERGSAMIIAITVISMCVLLSIAVASRTSSGLSSARQNQDFAGALADADAGVSDALFRVDQLGTGTPTAFCVGPGCTVTSVPAAPDVRYRVDVLDSNTVRVRSRGLDNGVPHAVEAEFVRQREFPFAIFTNTAMSFNGSADGPSCTQAAMPCTGVYYVDASFPANVVPSLDADVGTNGTVTCNGNGSPASHQATYPGGTNSGCPNAVVLTGAYDPQDPVSTCPAAPNTPPTPCLPASHVVLSATQCANQGGAIAPGDYLCRSDLTFTSNTTISPAGKVRYFVLPASGTVDVTLQGVSVNLGGDPTNLRIHLAGAGEIDGGNGSNAGDLTGILWAPSATSTNNGCKINIRGSLLVNDYTCNGSPHLRVQYDSRVMSLVQSNWTLRNFKEIPSSSVVTP